MSLIFSFKWTSMDENLCLHCTSGNLTTTYEHIYHFSYAIYGKFCIHFLKVCKADCPQITLWRPILTIYWRWSIFKLHTIDTYPMSARNSCILLRPLSVQILNLQANWLVWHILSKRVQWRYNVSLNSWSKWIFKQSIEMAVSSSSGLNKTNKY